MNPLAQGAPASTSSLVSVIGGIAKTTSLVVAEKFHKHHRIVLRAIGNLDCSPEFTEHNFVLSEYTDSTGRKLPYFEMTRDGFTFLAMGFTGKEAAKWKEAYIEAFNKMEAELNGRCPTAAAPPPPLTAPAKFVVSVDANGKVTTSPMTNMAPEGYALVDLDLLHRISAGAISLFYMHQVGMGIVHDLEKVAGRDLYNHDDTRGLK